MAKVLANEYENSMCYTSLPFDSGKMTTPESNGLFWGLKHSENGHTVLTSDSMPDLGEIRVYQRADFQSGSRVLKKVF